MQIDQLESLIRKMWPTGIPAEDYRRVIVLAQDYESPAAPLAKPVTQARAFPTPPAPTIKRGPGRPKGSGKKGPKSPKGATAAVRGTRVPAAPVIPAESDPVIQEVREAILTAPEPPTARQIAASVGEDTTKVQITLAQIGARAVGVVRDEDGNEWKTYGLG